MMNAIVLRYSFLVVLSAGMFACSSEGELPDPDALPYRIEKVQTTRHHQALFSDLDGDGRDEVVAFAPETLEGSGGIVIYTQEDKINCSNYEIPPLNQEGIQFVEVMRNGTRLVAVTSVHNDSLLVTFIDHTCNTVNTIPLASGQPYDNMPWDPMVRGLWLDDLDRDGNDELITVISTGHARAPRGLFIYKWPEGHLLDEVPVGAVVTPSHFGDYDGDGHPEIAFGSFATGNGAVAGGLDDDHSYVGLIDLSLPASLQWSHRFGGRSTSSRLRVGNIDGDGDLDIIAFTNTARSRPSPCQIRLIDARTGIIERYRQLEDPCTELTLVDLTEDGVDEIVVLGGFGDVYVLNGALKQLQHQFVSDQVQQMASLPDLDDDGVKEIFIVIASGLLFLDQDLRPKALAQDFAYFNIAQQGKGVLPYLYTWETIGIVSVTSVFRLAKNPYYLVYRYGPLAIGFLTLGLVLGAGTKFMHLYRRQAFLEATSTLTGATDHRGLLVLNASGHVHPLNAQASTYLGQNPYKARESLEIKDLQDHVLADFFGEIIAASLLNHERRLSWKNNGAAYDVKATADLLPRRLFVQPQWFVRLEKIAPEHQNPMWIPMARRIAHDLKNPLTSILLTLQHLQMDYLDRAPQLASYWDPHVAHIIDRIEHLRQRTRNFLKIAGHLAPMFTETDLSAFVQGCTEISKQGMPPDIELLVKLEKDLPAISIDQELMCSVLENLITNAISALKQGGAITISTQQAQGLRFHADTEAHDYVALEVMDTGEGIPESVLPHLFDTNFTTMEDGTGLGLAIVKKTIDDHGGHIEVESEPGKGTAFCIYLPVRQA